MNAKSEILARVRQNAPPASPLPELSDSWIAYPDRAAQFASVLQMVGGVCEVVSAQELPKKIAELPVLRDAKKIVCTASGVSLGNVDLASAPNPHDLADVDLTIVEGEFGVAENAAVWIDGAKFVHRAVLFLTQHVLLLLRADTLVNNMHEAYERLSFPGAGFGLFLSGPSKTADIEQSLVIGAHGARSLTVLLIRD